MTDILFIERLGDAFDAAIAEPLPRRAHWQQRRKALVLGLAVTAALAAAALAIAHILSTPDELAANSVACYAAANLRSNMTVVANDGAPVAACADAYQRMGQTVPAMVACANGSSVAVVPGADASSCARLGLEPMPAGFAASQAKVAKLAQGILALEASRDCIPPDELARGVEHLLADQGWVGWTVQVQSPSQGPCGSVSGLDGSGQRRIDGALDPIQKTVLVRGAPARSTMALLYGPNGLAVSLEGESGNRCYTVAALTALVNARAALAGRSASVELAAALPQTGMFTDARQARYADGCAVITDVRAASDGRGIVAVIPKPQAH
jgi:hypothetical protein